MRRAQNIDGLRTLGPAIRQLQAAETVKNTGTSWTDTFTTTGAKGSHDLTSMPASKWAMQVIASNDVLGYTVALEGSLDGTNWHTLVTSGQVGGGGVLAFADGKPALYARVNCSLLDLDGEPSISVKVLALA